MYTKTVTVEITFIGHNEKEVGFLNVYEELLKM